MGSHDCRVSGLINVKPAVTEADVRKALHGFLKAWLSESTWPGV